MSDADGWQKQTIASLFSSSRPGEWGTDGTRDNGTPVIRSTNFCDDGSIDYTDIAYRTVPVNRLDARRIRAGTILIEKAGGSSTRPAGRVVYCERDFGGTASNFVEVIQVGEAQSPKYVFYLLYNNFHSGLVYKYQQQTTGIINFKLREYGNEAVNIPESRAEQSKIAEVLSTVDRAIAQTEALIAKQQRIKTGLMQDLLTRGIDEHGQLRSEATHAFKDSPLGRIPVEWEVNLLDAIAERGSGHTPSKQHPEYWNGGIKWISLADSSALDHVHINETEYEISNLGIKNSSAVLHPGGTVVLSRDAGVGKSAVMRTSMAVSQHFMAWRCGRQLHNYFLYYWLQQDKPRFEGIASGSTIVTIGLQFFKGYRIAHPVDPREQVDIAKVLLKSEEDADRTQETLAKLQSLKTALMQDLLTGKVRVTPLLERIKEATA